MDKKLFADLVASVTEMKEIQAGKRKPEREPVVQSSDNSLEKRDVGLERESARRLAAFGGSQPHLKATHRRQKT